jgi:hypothetical protein
MYISTSSTSHAGIHGRQTVGGQTSSYYDILPSRGLHSRRRRASIFLRHLLCSSKQTECTACLGHTSFFCESLARKIFQMLSLTANRVLNAPALGNCEVIVLRPHLYSQQADEWPDLNRGRP